MRGVRRVLIFILGAVMALAVYVYFGFGDEVDGTYTFDPATIPADVEAYLSDSEARVPALRADAAKRVIWAGGKGEVTPLSIVYVHGFSASPEEIRPVPDEVAAALGANLHFTRLSGHGRDADAMGDPAGADWLADAAEAIEIGRRIGERVVVIGTSTGGALAAAAAIDAEMSQDLAGVVLISPNFKILNPAASVLTLPAVRWWGPRVAGEYREFEPRNAQHAAQWTTRYPTEATISLAHLTKYVRNADYRAAQVPALFIFSENDQVVDARVTQQIADTWGAPHRIERVSLNDGDDVNAHVIAGDILSPSQNAPTVARIVAWIDGL